LISVLTDIVKNSAAKFAANIAFKDGGGEISYTQLDQKSSQLAKRLLDFNVKPGDRVGIYLPRCIESVIAVYGIMKAGAVFVPLDPMAPTVRTAFLLDDCGINLLVTANNQLRKLRQLLEADISLQAVIGVDQEIGVPYLSWSSVFQTATSDFKPLAIAPEDLAYVMYTSGSTGDPKGIIHTHSSGLHYAKLSLKLYDLGPQDRVASHAPLHFDISTFSYFTAPLAGATTVIIPEAYTKVPVSLSDLLEKEKITFWYSVPLALTQLLSNGLLDERDLSPIRWVLFGGEVFPPKHLRALMKLWPQARFCNVYGPAEINQCTFYHIDSPPENDNQIPLGKIWFDAVYKILDHRDNEVRIGESGELVVCTNTMMKGYWNNPKLTERSLYRETDKEGRELVYFRTGDVVTTDAEGDLIFQGRNDRQIKIRGYRVELDEIEAILASHEQVKEAATFLMGEEQQDHTIGAAVILANDTDIDDTKLTAYCKRLLPSYAVPHRIEILTDFPRTSSGKVKRSELIHFFA
jgi:amino acid adenylation domain-containing protein